MHYVVQLIFSLIYTCENSLEFSLKNSFRRSTCFVMQAKELDAWGAYLWRQESFAYYTEP